MAATPTTGLTTSDQEPTTTGSKPPRTIRYLPTVEAYERWASVYDKDSNPLQALDDVELSTLLPEFLALLPSAVGPPQLKIVDLGCGTGRNTVKLVAARGVKQVTGLDASASMLAIARQRYKEGQQVLATENHHVANLVLEVYDMLDDEATGPVPEMAKEADAVVSTLVLEHVPLDVFFKAVASLLKPAGLCLLTNMHPDMGARSQAGFVDPRTGEKIRPVSYAHCIEDVVNVARRWELDVVGLVKERKVRADDVEYGHVGNRAMKWIGIKIWFGMILKKTGIEHRPVRNRAYGPGELSE